MTTMRRGLLWALVATVAFGITTPVIALVGLGLGTWSTAGWLYCGSALFAAGANRNPGALADGLRRRWPTLLAIAVVGGMLAPAAYVLGLHGAGAFRASLALNMEAPFSAVVAVVVFKEYIGRRTAAAMLAIVAGAVVLTVHQGSDATTVVGTVGVLLVVAATALWAIDNALSSRLPEIDPEVTIFWKSAIGGALSLLMGSWRGERFGSLATIVALLFIGAIGYGASLLAYLIAQRQFGVARTASVFAVSPLIGAFGAVLLGNQRFGPLSGAASGLMLFGIWLHGTEHHTHEHEHDEHAHEHVHRHDDLHHDHSHAEPVENEHSHPHVHEPIRHAHEHAPDIQHLHRH